MREVANDKRKENCILMGVIKLIKAIWQRRG